jgi:hypothetical protein
MARYVSGSVSDGSSSSLWPLRLQQQWQQQQQQQQPEQTAPARAAAPGTRASPCWRPAGAVPVPCWLMQHAPALPPLPPPLACSPRCPPPRRGPWRRASPPPACTPAPPPRGRPRLRAGWVRLRVAVVVAAVVEAGRGHPGMAASLQGRVLQHAGPWAWLLPQLQCGALATPTHTRELEHVGGVHAGAARQRRGGEADLRRWWWKGGQSEVSCCRGPGGHWRPLKPPSCAGSSIT